MFLESLLEAGAPAKRRRGWSTLISFLIETAAIGVLIVVPLVHPDALPAAMHWGDSIIALPTSGPPPQPPGERPHGNVTQPRPHDNPDRVIRVPTAMPPHPYVPAAPEPPIDPVGGPANNGPYIPGVPEGTGRGNPVLDNLVSRIPVKPPEASPKGPVPVISTITEGMLIHRVQPVYPQMAILTRTEGQVVLRAVIGRDGVIRQVEVLRGHPLLVGAAVDAVRQWRYRPYYLGGQAVEVETQVIVNFVLNR